MTRTRAKEILLKECVEAGKFYFEMSENVNVLYDLNTDNTYKNIRYRVAIYYHPYGVNSFLFEDEMGLELFLDQLNKYNGYTDYSDFYQNCDYDINQKLEQIMKSDEVTTCQ